MVFSAFSNLKVTWWMLSAEKNLQKNQRALNPHPNLHSPIWVGSKGGRPQRGGTNMVVRLFLYGRSWGCLVMTGHIGTNTPKFVPPRWGRPPFDPTQTGLCKFGRGFGARLKKQRRTAASIRQWATHPLKTPTSLNKKARLLKFHFP